MWAALAADDRVLWTSFSGFADVNARRAPNGSMPGFTGSVGKRVTVTAAMQLAESGKPSLDGDTSLVLGHQVVNPAFPGQCITLRHLQAHLSGIRDAGFKPGDEAVRDADDGQCGRV
jgi:CubicO group peptidase (beta-lactamase class C family)